MYWPHNNNNNDDNNNDDDVDDVGNVIGTIAFIVRLI